MKLDWDILLNDNSTHFPKTLFFEESTAARFRYGINTELQYCLFFRLPPDIRDTPAEPVTMANISLAEEIIEGHPTLILTLLNDNSKNLFSDLIISLVSQTSKVEDRLIKAAFIRLCNEWFELFDPLASGLNRQELQGIFAELCFLRYLLTESGSSADHILSSWKGPFGKGHDFELGEHLFEVKSIAENNPLVHISSEYQLDYLAGQHLFLVVYTFSSLPTGGITIDDIVQEITGILLSRTRINMTLFWTALCKTGLSSANLSDYDGHIFSIKSLSSYTCQPDDFPSVKRTNLPDAVRNVKYEIALSGLTLYEIDDITAYI
jgi:hypothetical protein